MEEKSPIVASEATKQIVLQICNNAEVSCGQGEYKCAIGLRAAAEQETDTEQKYILELLRDAMSPSLNAENADEPYSPMLIMGDRRSFTIEDYSESDLTELQTLANDIFPEIILARICDILWVAKQNYLLAKRAVDCYLHLAEVVFDPEKWVACVHYIRRANVIANQLSKGANCIESVTSFVESKIVLMNGTDPLFLSLILIELQLDNKKGDIGFYLGIAEKVFANALSNCSNQRVLEDAYKLELRLLRAANKPNKDIKLHMMRFAQYCISCADKLSGNEGAAHMALQHLHTAIPVLRECREDLLLADVRRKMELLQKQSLSEMQMFTHTMDLTESAKKISEMLQGKSLYECLFCLIDSTTIYKKSKLQDDITNLSNGYFTRHLFPPTILDKDGKIIVSLPSLDVHNPTKDTNALEMHMHYEARRLEDIHGSLLRICLDIINEQHSFAAADLDFVFRDNIIIPDGRTNTIRKGIYLGLTGEYNTALYLLVPQIENLFRHIARECGAVVTTFEDKDGSEQAKVLSSLFELQELVESYDENVLFTFKGLLNEKAGANLRNRLSHGLMDSDEASNGTVIYFICLCFKLLAWYSNDFLNMIEDRQVQQDQV